MWGDFNAKFSIRYFLNKCWLKISWVIIFPILLLFIYFSGDDWPGQEDGCSCSRPSCQQLTQQTSLIHLKHPVQPCPSLHTKSKNTSERLSWSALVQVIHQHRRWRQHSYKKVTFLHRSLGVAHWCGSLVDEYLRRGWLRPIPVSYIHRPENRRQHFGRVQATSSSSEHFFRFAKFFGRYRRVRAPIQSVHK